MAGMGWRARRVLVAVVALALLAGVLVVGAVLWERHTRTRVEQAMRSVPASSLRVGFTDWAAVRKAMAASLGKDPSRQAVGDFIDAAYDKDFTAASSIDESAGALQELFGFSPATVEWETFAQGKAGAAMVLQTDQADFATFAENLRALGYKAPKQDDGVWEGGPDLVAGIDPTITPELQFVVLLEGEGKVVSSDNPDYVTVAADAARGDADSVASVGGVDDLVDGLGDPASAMLWAGDFACSDLAMSSADEESQDQAEQLVRKAGGIDPLAGLAMGMAPDRVLEVVEGFEDAQQAKDNLRPRAELAVGEAVGRGGSFADDFRLTSSKAVGATVRLQLVPRSTSGYVLSALYDGPVVFATC